MSALMQLNKQKIQKLRNTQCWSQEELATATGLSIRTIQRVEKTGNASLETVKALASVFQVEPNAIKAQQDAQHVTFNAISKYGWIIAFAIAFTLFGAWVIDILIPTLKGADFNQQYELHGNFRYLDFGSISFIIGFVWLGINIFVDSKRFKTLNHSTSEQSQTNK